MALPNRIARATAPDGGATPSAPHRAWQTITARLRSPALAPWMLLALVMLFGLSGMPWSTWLTLTIAGLGMGMMIFVMATGLTLTFGLMDVLNLGHGALIAIGGFVGATVITGFEFGVWPGLAWLHGRPSPALAAGICAAAAGAMLLAAVAWLAGRGGRARNARRRPGRGAIIAATVVGAAAGALALRGAAPHALADLGAVVAALAAALLVVGALGVAFEFLFIRPVYRDPLRQILITVGASYLIAELLKAEWGPGNVSMGMPSVLSGSFLVGGVAIEKYRLLAAVLGLAVYALLQAVVHRTRVGLLIRAGVENVEMVQALGYRIRRLFVAVFVVGAALAGLGGAMWGLYQGQVGSGMGAEMLVLIIIVVIMGGLGSITGCLIASILVGLLSNYTTYIVPQVSLFSSIGLMVVVLLLWPRGLVPVR